MRYAQRGGYTPAEQQRRERLRLEAAGRFARGPRYHQAFHDVTKGNNTVQFPPKTITGYQAAPGWDPATGWGSPDAQVLIPLLARHAVP